MSISVSSAPVVPVMPDVMITMSHEDARKLRRVCYYNKTVSAKYANNPIGGVAKGQDLDVFLNSLGHVLKANGVDRF